MSPEKQTHPGARRVRATESVQLRLTEELRSGRYSVGGKLPPETALARQFGVSRSVVREALRGLHALGLTHSRPGKGTYVLALEPVEESDCPGFSAQDLLEARRHLEISLAGHAAERRTPEDVALLTVLLAQMAGEPDTTAWLTLDRLLHGAIARAAGNQVLLAMAEWIRDALVKQPVPLRLVADQRARADADHAEIVDAIRGGRADLAGAAMARHVGYVEASLGAQASRCLP